jgi:hypothetical protein
VCEDIVAYLNILNSLYTVSRDDLLPCEKAAQDGPDTRLPGAFVELDGAIHAAVIGERQRVHPTSLRRCDQAVELRLTVEQAVLGVDVQVGEIRHSAPPWGMMNADNCR